MMCPATHSSKESTESIFFPMTKLFLRDKDEKLRRMMYLVIKELKPDTDCVIIVTSTLTKDMNSSNDLYRANSIRVLCTITDTSMLMNIERYLKQAIVDKQPLVSSAALVAGMKLMRTSPEIVRRWVNEVMQALQDKNAQMVQVCSRAIHTVMSAATTCSHYICIAHLCELSARLKPLKCSTSGGENAMNE